MSLEWCRLEYGDQGTITFPGSRTYQSTYLAKSNNPYDTPASIISDPKCPQIGNQLDSNDTLAWVRSVNPTRAKDSKYYWNITVQASTEFDVGEINPILLPSKISASSNQRTITQWKNIKGDIIRNKAGTIIPQEVNDTDWLFSVTKNYKDVPSFLLDVNNKINKSAVTIRGLKIPKKKLMMFGLRFEDQETTLSTGKYRYVTVSFNLLYNRWGFKAYFMNADIVELEDNGVVITREKGGRAKRDANGNLVTSTVPKNRVPIYRGNERVTSPWPLDENGRALPENYTIDQLLLLSEDVYEETSFGLLPLNE